MGLIKLFTGGAKSGKSGFALDAADCFDGRKIFIATAEPCDEEMRTKIRLHQQERPSDWSTLEIDHHAPGGSIAALIQKELSKGEKGGGVLFLVDCLSLWLSDIMLKSGDGSVCDGEKTLSYVHALVDVMVAGSATFFIVTNEVGCSIVPENRLARTYRNLSGQMNKIVAQAADELYLLVCGVPLKIK